MRFLVVALALAALILPAAAKPAKMRDIADTIANNPILTNFAKLVAGADLGTFLSSRGPFTVFAPTDSAFAKLPPGTLQALLLPTNKERLQHIVLSHILNAQRLTAKDITTAKTLPSCDATPFTFKTTRTGTELVNKARIIHADIHCSNGIINEVDTILMPPESALPQLGMPMATASSTNSATIGTNAQVGSTNAANVPAPPPVNAQTQ